MARKLRIQYEGDQDREAFLETLGQCCTRTGWQIHALCLMPNHFHLVLETPQPNLVAGMKWLLRVFWPRSHHKVLGLAG